MTFLSKFIKLTKSEPTKKKSKKRKSAWSIDESKCLKAHEVTKLRGHSSQIRASGLKDSRFSQVRRWFMIELGLYAGLRVTEMATLQHANLRIDQHRSSIAVVGKGDKKRSVWIDSNFRQVCRLYISYKAKFGYDTSDDASLLNNLGGTVISKRALQKDFEALAKGAGLPSHFSIHCLRHTYATFLLKASNYNYRFVQKQLGHASIRTTQVYASVLESDGRKALEKIYRQRD